MFVHVLLPLFHFYSVFTARCYPHSREMPDPPYLPYFCRPLLITVRGGPPLSPLAMLLGGLDRRIITVCGYLGINVSKLHRRHISDAFLAVSVDTTLAIV